MLLDDETRASLGFSDCLGSSAPWALDAAGLSKLPATKFDPDVTAGELWLRGQEAKAIRWASRQRAVAEGRDYERKVYTFGEAKGTAQELAKRFGVTPTAVRQAARMRRKAPQKRELQVLCYKGVTGTIGELQARFKVSRSTIYGMAAYKHKRAPHGTPYVFRGVSGTCKELAARFGVPERTIRATRKKA